MRLFFYLIDGFRGKLLYLRPSLSVMRSAERPYLETLPITAPHKSILALSFMPGAGGIRRLQSCHVFHFLVFYDCVVCCLAYSNFLPDEITVCLYLDPSVFSRWRRVRNPLEVLSFFVQV